MRNLSFRRWLALEAAADHGDWWPEVKQLVAKYSALYPRAGAEVDGFLVRDDIPNTASISSSLEWYEELPGVRVVPTAGFSGCNKYHAADSARWCRELMRQLDDSREINPIIVGVDGHADGPWVIEGNHRSGAMKDLGVAHVPALVVLDLEALLKDAIAADAAGG